jgi:hypothetical protein
VQENVGIQSRRTTRDFFVTGEIRHAINTPSFDAAAFAAGTPIPPALAGCSPLGPGKFASLPRPLAKKGHWPRFPFHRAA